METMTFDEKKNILERRAKQKKEERAEALFYAEKGDPVSIEKVNQLKAEISQTEEDLKDLISAESHAEKVRDEVMRTAYLQALREEANRSLRHLDRYQGHAKNIDTLIQEMAKQFKGMISARGDVISTFCKAFGTKHVSSLGGSRLHSEEDLCGRIYSLLSLAGMEHALDFRGHVNSAMKQHSLSACIGLANKEFRDHIETNLEKEFT